MGVPSAHPPAGGVNGSAEHLGSEQGLPSDAGQIARLVMEGVSNGIAALDIEGRFTLVNPAGCEIVGRSAEALIGRPFVDVVAPEHLADLIEQLSRVVQHRDRLSGIELDVVRPNGERRTVRASLAPIVHSGTVTGVMGTAEDITEQRLAAERRSRVETSWRRITEAMFDLVCMLDEQARFVMVTPRFTSVLGYQPEELVGTFAFERIHPDDRQEVAKSFAEALVEPDGRTQRFRFRAADGRWVWFEANANTIPADGGMYMVVVARDITERLQMDEELRANEERLRAFMANAPVILFAVDKDRRFRLAEGHGLTTIGRGRGSPLGRTIDEVHRDRPDLLSNIERALDGEEFSTIDELGGRTFETRLKPLRDRDGRVSGMIGVAVDVTDRVRAERSLAQSEERLRTFLRNVPVILFGADRHGVFTLYEGKGLERVGLRPGQFVGRSIYEVHGDHPQIIRNLERTLAGEEFSDRVTIGLVTFDVHHRPLRDDSGAVVGMTGVMFDVTDRVLAEERLRRSEERYRAIYEGHSAVQLLVDTESNVIVGGNQAACTFYGYSAEELAGLPLTAISTAPPDVIERRSALALERATCLRTRHRLKSGEIRDVEVFAGALELDGRTLLLGIVQDISERVRAEAALEEKSRLLELALATERERARRDALTGALNHAAVTEELRQAIKKRNGPVAIAMVDVDGLKTANDMYGHQFGDAVLVTVAQQLARSDAIVGRYGGDEFLVLLPGLDRAAAERYRREVVESLGRARVEEPATGTRVPVVASIGIAVYPDDASAIDELIRVSDGAMYATRRNRVVERPSGRGRSAATERTAHMVGEVIPLLTREASLGEKLRMVANRVSLGAGYDAVNIVLGSGEERHFASGAFGQISPDLFEAWNRRQRGSEALRERMHRTRRPVIVDDFSASELLNEDDKAALAAMGLRSGLVAPMLWGDEMVGVFSAASSRPAAFSVRDAEFVMDVATQVTAVVRMSTLLDQLRETSARLRDAHEGTVLMLASAAEAHDMTTGRHLSRVRDITMALARELGYSDIDAQELGLAATLHDIGKIRVPDSVLGSSQALAEAEWMLMKQHTLWGSAFLDGQPGFELATVVARSHHERWDGGGYPDGLAGDQIPEAAQITTVADSLDAMTNDRPYRAGRPLADAVAEIVACSGTQFSPRVVQALVRLYERGELGFVRDGAHEHAKRARAA